MTYAFLNDTQATQFERDGFLAIRGLILTPNKDMWDTLRREVFTV